MFIPYNIVITCLLLWSTVPWGSEDSINRILCWNFNFYLQDYLFDPCLSVILDSFLYVLSANNRLIEPFALPNYGSAHLAYILPYSYLAINILITSLLLTLHLSSHIGYPVLLPLKPVSILSGIYNWKACVLV